MKKILLLLLLIPFAAHAQKLPEYGFYKFRIATTDSTIEAEALPVKALPREQTGRLYYWYSANTIHATQGGFSGKLLNGTYNAYYPDKSLKSQGQFKKGLKDGIWRSWDDKGNMQELFMWKNGLKNGTYQLFDAAGQIRESGTYRDGALQAPGKPPLWERLNIFKKKKKE